MPGKKINVAIIGLGFGAEFIPLYQRHPNANMYAICQRTRKKLDAIGDAFGIEKRYTDFNELLKDPNGMYRRIYDIQTKIDAELEDEIARVN